MTLRIAAAGWAVWLCCVACGGNTSTAKREPGTSSGGATSAGGTGSAGSPPRSDGGTSVTLTCDGPQPICLPDCASPERAAAECVDREYRCPDGWLSLDSCSPEACARRSRSCCAPTGQATIPNCRADGTIGDCPDGFVAKPSCLPEGLGITTCLELKTGDTCASEELVCYTSKCGYNCACEPDPAGVLTWLCGALPC